MAQLKEYGQIDYQHILDFNTHNQAIKSIIGISLYPIVEDIPGKDSLYINGYEKSFWSKKKKGFIILEYIEDAKIDLSKCVLSDNDDGVFPQNAEILIGFRINSEFTSFYVPGSMKKYEVGESRMQLLSYGKLIEIVDIFYNMYSQEQLKELQSESPMDKFLSGNIGFSNRYLIIEKELDELRIVKRKLKFIENYLQFNNGEQPVQ